jgi:outer membrane protein assembly factor BamB
MTHASPVAANILGTRQVIFFTQSGLVSVAPKSGEVLWRHKFRYNVSTAASPIVGGDIVYCSAGYGVGASAAKITKTGKEWKATELWMLPGNNVCNHWSTPVYHDGYLYGLFSFKQYKTGPMKCVELATGKEMWSQPGFGAGQLIFVDNHCVVLTDQGELVLVKPDPKAYNEVSRVKAVEGKCWSTPSISNGRIFARSTKEGICLDVTTKTAVR